MSDKEPVTLLRTKCLRETEKAILVELNDGQELWVPKSQVDDDSEVYQKGDTGSLVITAWFASREGLD